MQTQKARFTVTVDGKWQGGSFASKAEAEAAADALRADQKNDKKPVLVIDKSELPKAPPADPIGMPVAVAPAPFAPKSSK